MTKKQISPSDSVSKTPVTARTRSRGAKHSKAAVTPVIELAPLPESVVLEEAAEVLYDRDEIALLAYSYWEARGYRDGSQEQDWLRAEKEFENRQKLAGNV